MNLKPQYPLFHWSSISMKLVRKQMVPEVCLFPSPAARTCFCHTSGAVSLNTLDPRTKACHRHIVKVVQPLKADYILPVLAVNLIEVLQIEFLCAKDVSLLHEMHRDHVNILAMSSIP